MTKCSLLVISRKLLPMRNLIIIRHLKCGPDGFELPEALKDFQELLSSVLKPESIGECIVLSSPALRASRTAGHFAKHIGNGTFVMSAKCLDQKENPEISDLEEIFCLVEQNIRDNIDTVTIVTHREYTDRLLDYLTDRLYGKELRKSCNLGNYLSHGQMIVYCVENDTEQLYGPRKE